MTYRRQNNGWNWKTIGIIQRFENQNRWIWNTTRVWLKRWTRQNLVYWMDDNDSIWMRIPKNQDFSLMAVTIPLRRFTKRLNLEGYLFHGRYLCQTAIPNSFDAHVLLVCVAEDMIAIPMFLPWWNVYRNAVDNLNRACLMQCADRKCTFEESSLIYFI